MSSNVSLRQESPGLDVDVGREFVWPMHKDTP